MMFFTRQNVVRMKLKLAQRLWNKPRVERPPPCFNVLSKRAFSTKTTRTTETSGGLLSWYSSKLDSHPILTKSITSAFVGGTGDLLSQLIEAYNEKKTFSWDAVRTSRFGCLMLFYIGPAMHYWYGGLMRWLPGQSVSTVIKRVGLDQFLATPIILPTFLSGLWLLEGTSIDKIPAALQEQVPPTIVANWALWIPAQIINFRFVPGKYQVLFSNFTGLVWNAYLSYAVSDAGEKKEKAYAQTA